MVTRNKGQLSIETMIIYGLVILVALSVVGGLLYFDVLNVGSYLPEECDLGTPDLDCQEFGLSSSSDTFTVGVRNIGQRAITDLNITVIDSGNVIFDSSQTGNYTEGISPGALVAIDIVESDDNENIARGDILEGQVLVNYAYAGGVVKQEAVGNIRITAS